MTDKVYTIKKHDYNCKDSIIIERFKNEDSAKEEIKKLAISNELSHIRYYYTVNDLYE